MKFLDIQAHGHALGRALGQWGQAAVHTLLLPSAAWHSVQAWKGSTQVQAMQQLTQQHFPHIWAELEGLAEGLGLRVEDTFLWNCRGDVWAMAPDGCTTVQLPATAQQGARLSHNEDGLPFFQPHCAMVRVQSAASPGSAKLSFAYPGSILGHTFAVTEAGWGMAVNNIRTRRVGVGVPRMVLVRAALDMTEPQAVVQLLQRHPRAGGFHLSLVQVGEPHITSVEFTNHRVSVQEIVAPSLHANHLLHPAMRHHPQWITHSSGFRQERGLAMLQACAQAGHAVDPLEVLRDQHHLQYPIYRDAPDDSDDENTMATADMRVCANGVHWAVYQGRSAVPVFQFHNTQRVS